MPQKSLFKANKKLEKKKADNRHGKKLQQKKGHFDKAPKKAPLLALHEKNMEISRAINHKNEAKAASQAAQGGGRLSVIKAPPPCMAPADQKKRKAAAAATAAQQD